MGIYGIAAFRSRQQVLRLDAALKREGIACQVVATPRDVALGCGLSVRFDIDDAADVMRTINRIGSENLIGVYQVDPSVNGRGKLTALKLVK